MKDKNNIQNKLTAPANRRMRFIALANILGVPLIYWLVFILIPSMMMTEIAGTLVDSGHYLNLVGRRRAGYFSTTTHVFLFDNYNSPLSVKEIDGAVAPGLSSNLQKYKKLSDLYYFEGHNVGVWVMKSTLARLNENPLSDAEKEVNLDLLDDKYIQNDKGFARKVRDGKKMRNKLPRAYGLIIDGTVIEGPKMSLWNHRLQRWAAIFAGLWWFFCFALFLQSFPRLNKAWKIKPKKAAILAAFIVFSFIASLIAFLFLVGKT
ncbi:hypothetical protein FACS189464_2210 [Bacteroidia bacterium]|nr:hypothetical protein FACS189464_2210 [Bacteroidia bacterium]